MQERAWARAIKGLLDDKWLMLCAIVAGLAVAKGLRLPNLWSATQMQVDYSTGFVKRGLAGEIAAQLHVPIARYAVFATVAFILLAVALGLLLVFVRTVLSDQEFKHYLPVFLSSLPLTYIMHLVGYLDILLLALTLLALLARGSRLAFPIGLGAGVAGVLIHESFVLSFFPVLVFAAVWDAMRTQGDERRRHLVQAATLIAVTGLATLLTATARPLTPDLVDAMRAGIESHADFAVRRDFFDVMKRSPQENIAVMVGLFRTRAWWLLQAGAVLGILWVALFYVWLSLRRVKTLAGGETSRADIAIVLASLAPVLLQIIGWDLHRWYAFAAINAFLIYGLVSRTTPGPARTVTVADYHVVSMLIALNIATGGGFHDGFAVNMFPYTETIFGF